jgi:hypothetical protein
MGPDTTSTSTKPSEKGCCRNRCIASLVRAMRPVLWVKAVGAFVLALAFLVPPWRIAGGFGDSVSRDTPGGYYPIWDPPSFEGSRIDVPRLGATVVAVLAATAGVSCVVMFVTTRGRAPGED